MASKGKVFIAGGAGYIGSRLVPSLLGEGYEVSVLDLCWFGNHLPPAVPLIKKDVFSVKKEDLVGFDAVIFLAGLSNDPMAEYSPAANFISNAAAPSYLAYQAKSAGVPRYVYADSCSVYGFTPNSVATEEDPAFSLYPYGISKLQGEAGVLQMADKDFSVICLRQGTISGYSPRMRFDLFINTMYMKASTERIITVNNPEIWRPLLPIDDAVQAYSASLRAPRQATGVFNVSAENYTVGDAAKRVADHFKTVHGYAVNIDTRNNKDFRNYRVSTEKAERELEVQFKGSVESILAELDTHIGPSFDFSKNEYYNIKTFEQIADKVSYLK